MKSKKFLFPIIGLALGLSSVVFADNNVATFKGGSISKNELEKKVEGQVYEMLEQIYNIEKDQLDSMVNDKLLELEAKEQKMAVSALRKKEIESKIREVTDKDVKSFYDANKQRIQQDFETVKGQVKDYLTNQGKFAVEAAYFEMLRKKYNVQINLTRPVPPLFNVDIHKNDPVLGEAGAPITIVEFSDFECPFCQRGYETMKRVMDAYKGKVKWIYKDFPLNFHPNAKKAAEAALCAQDQGKFWDYHHRLFESSKKLGRSDLEQHAKDFKLDLAKFNQCLDSDKYAQEVDDDQNHGATLGVNGTPAYFINGERLSGARPFEDFAEAIERQLAEKKEQKKKG